MNRHPLIATVLTIVLTLQLSLAGGGAGCAMPIAGSAAGAGNAMTRTAMPEMPADNHSSGGRQHVPPPC